MSLPLLDKRFWFSYTQSIELGGIMSGRARFLFFVSVAAFSAVFAFSCARRSLEPTREVESVDVKTAASVFMRPYASARTSVTPLWFEFGAEGPVSISGPLDSALTPFEPWPLARRAAGLVVTNNSIAIAANRDGFLSLVPRAEGEIVMYRVSDATRFFPYSVASVFLYNGSPTALLYRDRFFVDPVDPAPDPRSFSVVKGEAELSSIALPVLAAYPLAQAWDVESLAASKDGRVLLRAVRDGAVSYAAAASLDAEKSDITVGSYRSGLLPRSAGEASPPLRLVIEAAVADMAPKEAKVVTAYGKGRSFSESFALSPSESGNIESVLTSSDGEVENIWAYYDENRAFLLLPDGAFYTVATTESPVSRGNLPSLPDGFAYTGIALAGKTAVALWEEQDGWAVGSAGFLLMDVGL